MPLTNYGKDLAAKAVFTTPAPSLPTEWWVSLHTGDPGADGTASEVLVADDADYVRKQITSFADPVAGSGQCLSESAVSWTVNAATAGFTVTHAVLWDAVAGNSLISGELPVPKVVPAGGTVITFSIGEVIGAMV